MIVLCKSSNRVICIALLLFLAWELTAVAEDTQKGRASWYSTKECGGITASGKPLNDNALTVAHKKLPFGTIIRVTNLRNNKSVVVTVVDRGPFKKGRIVDLTRFAFSQIAPLKEGVVPIQMEVVLLGKGKVVNRS